MLLGARQFFASKKSVGYIKDGLLFSVSPDDPYFDGTRLISIQNDSLRTAFFYDFTIEFDICAERQSDEYGVHGGCIYYCGPGGNSPSLYNNDGVFLRWMISSVSGVDNALYEINNDTSYAVKTPKWGERNTVSLVYNASNRSVKKYINGSLSKTISRMSGWSDGNPPNDTLYIMGVPSELTNFGYTKGYLYNIRMYTRQLAGDEIVFNAGIDRMLNPAAS